MKILVIMMRKLSARQNSSAAGGRAPTSLMFRSHVLEKATKYIGLLTLGTVVGVATFLFSHKNLLLLADAGNNTQGGYCCLDKASKSCDSNYRKNMKSCVKNKGTFFAGPKGDDTLQKCNVQICGSVKEKNSCCLCFFHNDNGAMCSSRSQTDCTNDEGPAKCKWESGKCVDRFEAYCDSRLSGNNSCDTKMKVPFMFQSVGLPDARDKLTPDVISFLSKCTSLNELIESHSGEKQVKNVSNHVSVCLNVLGSDVSNINVKHNGCSTFGDLSAANQWMEKVRSELKPGQNLTITANQADATERISSYLSYHMTVTGNTVEYDQCRIGDPCFIDSNYALCTDQDHTIKEYCCKSAHPVVGKWSKDQCPVEPKGYCCNPSDVGNSCSAIVKESDCLGKFYRILRRAQCFEFQYHDCSNFPVNGSCCIVTGRKGSCYNVAEQYCEYKNGRYYGDELSCKRAAKSQCKIK